MNLKTDPNFSKLKKTLAWYNMIPNLLWSVINLVPISVFCYSFLARKSLYIFIAVSVLPMFFSNLFFDKIQIAKTTKTYRKLGINIINRVAQNGVIINSLIRKKFPEYKAITYKRSSLNRLIQQTYVFEKFHFAMFVVFSLITIYALSKNYFLWAIIISISNLLYNIYPNLLQQYIRLKLLLYNRKLK